MRFAAKSVFARMWDPEFPVRPRKFPIFYGWVVVAIATVGVVATIPGQTIGMGVFTDSLIEALAMSRVDLSLAYLLGTVGSGLLLPLGGRALDKWGIRRCAVLASFLMGLSLFFMANCDRIANALARQASETVLMAVTFTIVTFGFFLLRFLGQGILTLACRNMIGKWFEHRRGMAIAISGIAVSFLFSASPAVLNYFVESIGWRWTWIWMGLFLSVGISGIAWAFFRDNPEECGLTMDGGYLPPKSSRENPDLVFSRDFTRREALRSWAFWIPNLSFAWSSFFNTAYTFHVLSIGQSIGLGRTEILPLFLYASGFAIAANLLCGWVSAKTRVKYLLSAMNLMSMVFVVALVVGNPLLTSIGIVVGLGISGGLWSKLSGLVFPRFFGRAHLGAITGVFMACTVFASACGPYIFSLFEAAFGDYQVVSLICIIVPLLLTLAALFVENPQRKISARIPPEDQ